MEVIRAIDKGYDNRIAPLGNLKSGDVFRFSHIPFDDAISEKAFWLVVADSSEKRVSIVNVFDGQRMIRDQEHRVVRHLASVVVSEEL